MNDRIAIKKNKSSIVIVAPHGYIGDDENTDIISDVIADEIKANAVINVGWRRGEKAKISEGIANLNSLSHWTIKQVRKDFLNPFIAIKEDCIRKYGICNVFYIHGMSNKIRHVTKDNVDIVIGYGDGTPPSYTCRLGYKNALVVRLQEQGFHCYQGKKGGKFSARQPDNLTQVFREFSMDQRVQSVQIEIVNVRRYNARTAIETAELMSKAFDNFFHSETRYDANMFIKEF